jgi:hypothetical protein
MNTQTYRQDGDIMSALLFFQNKESLIKEEERTDRGKKER